jgi:hypothetical protein
MDGAMRREKYGEGGLRRAWHYHSVERTSRTSTEYSVDLVLPLGSARNYLGMEKIILVPKMASV